MDKRTSLALVLTALVIVGLPLVFRPPRPAAPAPGTASSKMAAQTPPATAAPAVVRQDTAAPSNRVGGAPARPVEQTPIAAQADTLRVTREKTVYSFVAPAAAPQEIGLPSYKDLSVRKGPSVKLAQADSKLPLLRYRLTGGTGDTTNVDQLGLVGHVVGSTVRFERPSRPAPGAKPLEAVDSVRSLAIEYQPGDRPYVTHVRGTITGPGPMPTQVLVELPQAFASFEADTLDDQRHNAYGYKPFKDEVASVAFTKLDSTQIRTDLGPMQWVAARNKYYLVALVAPDSAHAFTALRMRGGHRPSRGIATAYATAVAPVVNGQFSFDLYTGPQSWPELRQFGAELENVNPYGGWLHAVAQPFVTIVMRILLWLKATSGLNYGWVLVIFGVVLRLMMWPLNQSAMRSSIRMQRIQPELQAVQKRYASDPEAQRKAMMKLYQDHGMNPLSPLLGCLPMLLPMPVLFALYFVFQNTIEFRGVPFLWLPDLALRDPFYITPVAMGASMFLLSWIGLRGAPPNPQAKMMSYMMPVMLTFMFLNFASGLNLYYGVQNLVAIPQQWLLTRERARSNPSPAGSTGGKTAAAPNRARTGKSPSAG